MIFVEKNSSFFVFVITSVAIFFAIYDLYVLAIIMQTLAMFLVVYVYSIAFWTDIFRAINLSVDKDG